MPPEETRARCSQLTPEEHLPCGRDRSGRFLPHGGQRSLFTLSTTESFSIFQLFVSDFWPTNLLVASVS